MHILRVTYKKKHNVYLGLKGPVLVSDMVSWSHAGQRLVNSSQTNPATPLRLDSLIVWHLDARLEHINIFHHEHEERIHKNNKVEAKQIENMNM